MPLISILTPAYNAAEFLPDLIQSVLSQRFSDYEHVIIDDGSTDEGKTKALLSGYPHLRWFSRENRGQYATQNELLSLAKGEVVTIICADDFYANPAALGNVADLFHRRPDTDVAYGRTLIWKMSPGQAFSYDPYLNGWPARFFTRVYPMVQHCSVFVRSKLIREHQLSFDQSYRFRGDWDWLIRVFSTARRIRCTRQAVACWRHHPQQTSSKQFHLGVKETEILLERHGISPRIHNLWKMIFASYGLASAAVGLLRAYGLAQLIFAIKCRRATDSTVRGGRRL